MPEGFDGQVVAVTFFDTECSILCVGRLLDLAAVVKSLAPADREHVKILALTTTPARDTPAALKSFTRETGLDTTVLTLASGDPEAMDAVLASIGWRTGGRAPDTMPSTVFVFDRRGGFAMRYGCDPVDRPRLTQDLTKLAGLDRGVGQAVAEVSALH